MVPKGKTKWGDYIVCAEPAPDIAQNLTSKIEAQAAYAGATGGLSSDLTYKAMELAGRNSTILFLRECLYRICEAYMNGALLRKDLVAIYQGVIVTAAQMAGAAERSTMPQNGLTAALDALSTMNISQQARETAVAALLSQQKTANTAPSAGEVVKDMIEGAVPQGAPEP